MKRSNGLLDKIKVDDVDPQQQRLLKETRLSITNVAFEAGFGSFSSFLTAFRSHTGQTPLDYRQANSIR